MSGRAIRVTGIVVLVAALGAVALLYGFNGDAKPENGVPRYKEFVIKRGMFRVDVSATGVVQPIDRVEVKSKASGRIEELPVEEGDVVHAGDLICRLDKTDVQADVDQAKADIDIADAELKQAENTYQRRKQLFEKGLISEEELDQTDLQLAQAKGRMVRARVGYDQALVRLKETEVRSPIDGIILKKFVEAGQIISSGISNVSGGTAIVAVADMNRVFIEAGIDEIDVGKVRLGQKALVVADAFPRRRFSGSIIRIAPEAKVEQNVTQFNVVVEVENSDGLLKSGMNASVEITIVQKDDALLAPMMALSAPEGRQRRRSVRRALVKESGEFVPREVEIGRNDFRNAIVIAGLSEGDTVGVVMTSRLKAENDRLEQRIRSSRSFGSSGSSSSNKSKNSKRGK